MSSILVRKGLSSCFASQMANKQLADLLPLLDRRFIKIGCSNRNLSKSPVVMRELTDNLELLTGIAKREMLLKEAGCNDPWGMRKPLKRGSGKASEPTEIPSAFDARVVGCVCLGDRFIKWMWLEKGCPKRCECGHYFVLKQVPPV